jgi:monoamine oxidase
MHWPTFVWTRGSYTCYRPGQWAFWSLEGRRNGNLHFCGEHTSLDFQGWMEGGAETGALVAAEILDDQAVEKSARHAEIVAPKLLMPQACYHGDQLGVLRPRRRRVALARTLASLVR